MCFFFFSFLATICFRDKRNTKYEKSLDDNGSSGVHPKKVLEQSCVNQTFGQKQEDLELERKNVFKPSQLGT